MTIAHTVIRSQPDAPIRLPDPPEHRPEAMTTFRHLGSNGNVMHLAAHLGNRDTTIVDAERYLQAQPNDPQSARRIPDLIVAFGVKPELYREQNGYIISEQGKPPDFVLEVASLSTRQRDQTDKRDTYARWGIREYWRFDENPRDPATRLEGDLLNHGQYRPIAIRRPGPDRMQGFSPALNLYLRWEQGELHWIDPATGEHIDNFYSERAGRQRAEHRADTAETARAHAEAQALQSIAYAQTLEQELQALRAMMNPEQDDPAT